MEDITTKIIISIICGVFSALLFAIPGRAIFLILRKLYYVPFIRKKLLDKAIKEGHVVEARFMNEDRLYDDNGRGGTTITNYSIAEYKYEYKGRTYKYRARSRNRFPEVLTLYFLKNPRRACKADEIGFFENSGNWFLQYLFVVCILIAPLSYMIFKLFASM